MMKVFDKVLTACIDAYRNKYPIIFIRTEELELVREIASSGRLVVNMQVTDNDDTNYEPVVSRKIYLRYNQGNQGIANFYIDKKLSQEDMIPSVKIMYIGAKPDVYKEKEILEFLDRYTYSRDDNSVVRSSMILMYGNPSYLSTAIAEYCSIIDVPLPDIDEIRDITSEKIFSCCGADFDPDSIKNISYKLRGFTIVQIDKIIDNILSHPYVDSRNAVYDMQTVDSIIIERKKQILKKDSILELKSSETELKIGGMGNFLRWFDEISPSVSSAGQLYNDTGTLPVKGVLMCGVPGCGKSMAAKAVAAKLNIPLLQMEIGKIMGSLVGESEKNMAKALSLAEAMSPCVLWIDELDKAFSNAGSDKSEGDSGVFKRMFSELLTWMQENTKPCFIFATANDITGMPKEFFRSGRFEELFAVYMPTRNECTEILLNQMKMHSDRVLHSNGKILFDGDCYDKKMITDIIDGLVSEDNCKFVTGADIEKIVNSALRSIWTFSGIKNMITSEEWKKALTNAAKTTSVYGEGMENLDSVAMCYLKLLRKNFISASSDATVMFTHSDYFVDYDKEGSIIGAGIIEKADIESLSNYDYKLYTILAERINRMAKGYEINIRHSLIK